MVSPVDATDERGREMYWEAEQDLIRFGKFLRTWQEKTQSDPKIYCSLFK